MAYRTSKDIQAVEENSFICSLLRFSNPNWKVYTGLRCLVLFHWSQTNSNSEWRRKNNIICKSVTSATTKKILHYPKRLFLAVVRFCRYFRHYLLGRPFIVRTDLQIIHRSGNKHSNADGLSRIPDTLQPCDCNNAGIKVEELPCGGCRYCQREHQQWARFEEDVDDVVPLAIKGSALVSNCKSDSGTRLTRLSNESEFTILPTVSLTTLFETHVETRLSRLPKVLETEVLEADQSRKETDQEDVPCDEKW